MSYMRDVSDVNGISDVRDHNRSFFKDTDTSFRCPRCKSGLKPYVYSSKYMPLPKSEANAFLNDTIRKYGWLCKKCNCFVPSEICKHLCNSWTFTNSRLDSIQEEHIGLMPCSQLVRIYFIRLLKRLSDEADERDAAVLTNLRTGKKRVGFSTERGKEISGEIDIEGEVIDYDNDLDFIKIKIGTITYKENFEGDDIVSAVYNMENLRRYNRLLWLENNKDIDVPREKGDGNIGTHMPEVSF